MRRDASVDRSRTRDLYVGEGTLLSGGWKNRDGTILRGLELDEEGTPSIHAGARVKSERRKGTRELRQL